MSVLVKGMRMPHDCFECPLSVPPVSDDSPLWMCGGNAMSIHEADTEERRPYNCPLVEIPSGERLIGADTLCRHILYLKGDDFIKYGFIHIVECEPSIVEAEEKDDVTEEAERICGNCKHGHGDGLQSYVYCKGKNAMVWEYNNGCERWEKE